jgi:hypothetical protein
MSLIQHVLRGDQVLSPGAAAAAINFLKIHTVEHLGYLARLVTLKLFFDKAQTYFGPGNHLPTDNSNSRRFKA